jgi:ubiquinone/menaquinone biosynthesis C-methylase UbiE
MDSQPEETQNTYVLGSDFEELARLDRQAAWLEPATRMLLVAAGLSSGLRVLDLGTGLGHVARLTGRLVGPEGSVVGLDRAAQALAVARQRVEAAGERHVSFVEGDVGHWRADEPFDVVVGRLVLFHLADPLTAVRHHVQNLGPGGLFVAIDIDYGAARAEPPVALVTFALDWVMRAFAAAGASPRIGAHLGPMLARAGLDNVTTFGVQDYLLPDDPSGPDLLAGIVRSVADGIARRGVTTVEQPGLATVDQLGIATLEGRIAAELHREQAVLLPPTIVGAWGRRPHTNA